jgi:hypothetical protein
MERENKKSLERQRLRRQFNDLSEQLIDPVTRQNFDDQIEKLKDYRSSGRMDSTRGPLGARAISDEIDRLEEGRQQAQDQLAQALEADRQRGGAGQDASRDTGDEMPTIEERERAAGLYNTTTGRGLDDPTMEERERDAGLIGRDRSTTGIVPSPVPTEQDFPEEQQTTGDDGELPDAEEQDDPLGTFGVIICVNGRPHRASIYGQVGGKLT